MRHALLLMAGLLSLLGYAFAFLPSLQNDNSNGFMKRNFGIAAASLGKTENKAFKEDLQDDDDEDILLLNFIHMTQTSPVGQLESDDIDLLREIMTQLTPEEKRDIEGIETAQVVETLLGRLVSEWEKALDDKDAKKEKYCRPSSSDFEVAMKAWEKSRNPDKVVHVLSLLSDQRELFLSEEQPSLKPTLSSIKTILRILASSRERGLDKRAAQVFDSLEELGLEPDADLYGLMVTIIARSRAPGAAQRAENMLRKAVELFPPGLSNGKFVGVKADPFNSVVVAYAKSGMENGAAKAEELIAFMNQVDSDNGSFGICSPNINTFTSLIDAYCQQNEWDSVGLADRMLNRLLSEYLAGNDDLEPSVATWTIVISAWGRLSKKNRRGAADRAGRLLRRMEELHREGRISSKPDAITYVTCMNAYAFSRGGEDAGEAEKLLDEMNDLYLDGGDSMKPSPRSVRVVADAWIKSGDMDSAESFIDDYEQYLVEEDSPENITEETVDMYRSFLHGHSKIGNMERAKFYLDHMIEKDMKPDNLCFDRLIEGYAKVATQGALKHALQVFELLEKCRRLGEVKPNERVYTSFMRALTRCKAIDMHKKAEALLKRMHTLYESGDNDGIKPTVFTYNAVLNACAESRHVEGTDLDEAFKTAVKVFNEFRNSPERFDHVTFGNMLRCAHLLPEGTKRDKYVSATFRLCCEQGFVNSFVLRDLQLVVDEEIWRQLLDLDEGEPDLDLLPSDWSYQIPKEKSIAPTRRGNDFNRNSRGRSGHSRRN